jgi:hypothetical protein
MVEFIIKKENFFIYKLMKRKKEILSQDMRLVYLKMVKLKDSKFID